MRRMLRLLPLVAIMLVLLPGCWSRRELNDLAITLGVAIDKKGEQYEVTVQVVNPQEMAAKKSSGTNTPVTMYHETGNTILETIRRLTTHTPRKIYLSHLRILVISEELAREGLRNVLDLFARDHELRTDFYVIVARGTSAATMLSILEPQEKVSANYLYETLEVSQKNWSPTTGIFLDELLSDLMSRGKDVALTGVRVSGNLEAGTSMENLKSSQGRAHLRYSSIGVFREDKLLGWLNEGESRGYNFIINKVKNTVGEVECPDGGSAVVELIRSKTDMKGVIRDGKPEIDLTVSAEGSVGEVACRIDLTKEQSLRELEKTGTAKLKKRMEQALRKAQEQFHADIFGFGDEIRRADPKMWERIKDQWRDSVFPELPVNISIKMKIRRTGTQSNSFINKMGE